MIANCQSLRNTSQWYVKPSFQQGFLIYRRAEVKPEDTAPETIFMLHDPYWPNHAAKGLGVEMFQVMPPLHQLFIGR